MSTKNAYTPDLPDPWAVFATLVLLAALLAGGAFTVSRALATPDVYVSTSSRACVDVIGPTDSKGEETYSCRNLPLRYNVVWVSDAYQPRR